MHRFTVTVNDVSGEVEVESNIISFQTVVNDHVDKLKMWSISVYDVVELLRSRRDERSAKMIYIKKKEMQNESKVTKNEEVSLDNQHTYSDENKRHDDVAVSGGGKDNRTSEENKEAEDFVKEAVVLKFASLAEREQFINLIVDSKSAPPSFDANNTAIDEMEQSSERTATDKQRAKSVHRMSSSSLTTDQWRTRAICAAAIDSGVIDDEEELERIISNVEKEENQNQRGVVQVFDALESLVDPETLELRPITEQLENDIFREIPVLAVIYSKRVLDADARRSFWEAVVQKYFCFSRTFLEDDFRLLESDSNNALNEHNNTGTDQRFVENANIGNNNNNLINNNNNNNSSNSVNTSYSVTSESGRMQNKKIEERSAQTQKNNSDQLEVINTTSLQALPKLVSNDINSSNNINNRSVNTNTHKTLNIAQSVNGISTNNNNNNINDNGDNESDDELHLLELIENDEINRNDGTSSETQSVLSNFFSPQTHHYHSQLGHNRHFLHALSQEYNDIKSDGVKMINKRIEMESSFIKVENIDRSCNNNINNMPTYYTAHPVEHTLPQEPSDRSMLELLRQFWRCQPKQRAAMAASFTAQIDVRSKANSAKGHAVNYGFLLSNCYKRAREVAENLEHNNSMSKS